MTNKRMFLCRTRRMANYLMENGETMKQVVTIYNGTKRGLAFMFEQSETLNEHIEKWQTEKDTYRNPD